MATLTIISIILRTTSPRGQFLSLLSSFNLTQHVNFPTDNKHHILDLVITSSDCSVLTCPISHFLTLLSIRSFPCLHHTLYKPFTSSSSDTPFIFLPPVSPYRYQLISQRSKIISSHNSPTQITWLPLDCIQYHTLLFT